MAELHLISDGRMALHEFATIAGKAEPWLTAVHLREKARTASELWQGVQLLQAAGMPLDKVYINDRVDVAQAAGVRGVQLAWHSLELQEVKRCFPGLRVGRSVHTLAEAIFMAGRGADYLLYGHIFASASKPDLAPRGVPALTEVCKAVRVPVIAIGGITPQRVPELMGAGAAGIAIMSGILGASDPMAAAIAYKSAMEQALEHGSTRGE